MPEQVALYDHEAERAAARYAPEPVVEAAAAYQLPTAVQAAVDVLPRGEAYNSFLIPMAAKTGNAIMQRPKRAFIGGLALLGFAAVALEFNPFGMEDVLAVSSGHGTLETVAKLPFPKECNEAFVSKVEGAESKYSKKLTVSAGGVHLSVPTTYSDTETFNGDITSEVCRDATKVTVKLNEKAKKVTVTVPGDAYHTTTYMKDPATSPFTTTHNGLANAAVKIFETEAHVLPLVHYQGATDSLSGRLRGYAYLAAQQTASEGCGKVAWQYVRPMEKNAIKTEVLRWAHALNPELGALTLNDVTVELPGKHDVKLASQYGDELAKIKKKAGSSLQINVPEKAGACDPSPKLATYMKAHPNGNTAALTSGGEQ